LSNVFDNLEKNRLVPNQARYYGISRKVESWTNIDLTKDNRLHSIWLFLFGGKVMKVFIEAPLKPCVEGTFRSVFKISIMESGHCWMNFINCQ
jgi:hypothetical protein